MHEFRTFAPYYLREYGKQLYLPRTHGVKTKGFSRLEETLVYEFSIVSPSVKDGERKYLLPFTRFDAKSPERISKHYQGLIGESVLRITITELLRRQSVALGIKEFSFSKGNFNPLLPETYALENHDYRMRHLTRYNVAVENLTRRTLAEYDGLIHYTPSANLPEGVLICESKTGYLDTLRGANRKEGRENIHQRIIKPLHSLFPEQQKDLLLMAHPAYIFSSQKERIVNKNIASLSSFLTDQDIGLLVFTFPISSADIRSVANEIAALRKGFFPEGVPVEESLPEFPDQAYILSDDILRLIKGRRVEMMLQRLDGKNWVTVYSNEEKDGRKH